MVILIEANKRTAKSHLSLEIKLRAIEWFPSSQNRDKKTQHWFLTDKENLATEFDAIYMYI